LPVQQSRRNCAPERVIVDFLLEKKDDRAALTLGK